MTHRGLKKIMYIYVGYLDFTNAQMPRGPDFDNPHRGTPIFCRQKFKKILHPPQ